MKTKNLNIPAIAVTGSTGKTTTREFIASILETKWKILKTPSNKNLPRHTRRTIEALNPSHQAVLLELALGMGRPGVGEKHFRDIQPNISVITNIGTAHFGKLGNDIRLTAKSKSILIQNTNPKGILLTNNDDENSKLLDTKKFKGKFITVGIHNQADFQAKHIKYLKNGMSFQLTMNQSNETFFIPTFGIHMIYNALFAIAITYKLNFTPSEIRQGLERFKAIDGRMHVIPLRKRSLLIDDSANANPQSMKAAIDVLAVLGKDKKKIAVLGTMLELGDHTTLGHLKVGKYLAKKKVDAIYTCGSETKWIRKGAVDAGFPIKQIHHFKERDSLNHALKDEIKEDQVILVKGSNRTRTYETARYIQNRFMFSILFDRNINQNTIHVNSQALEHLNTKSKYIILHYGAAIKKLKIIIDNKLKPHQILIPPSLTDKITIPYLPYEYRMQKNHFFLGPVIGLLISGRYYDDPGKQLSRFTNYDRINGLIFLFKQNSIDMHHQTIEGYYYHPKTKKFVLATLPYPCVIFNRVHLKRSIYKHFKNHRVEHIFNYPCENTDKWKFWEVMSKRAEIKNHLPKTKKYEEISRLARMLNRYGAVYLKPATLARGNGIFYVKKNKQGYQLLDKTGKEFFTKSRRI